MRNIKTHQQIEPLLAYYRDLEHEERDLVDQHVAHCASCARQLAAYGQMDQELAQLMEREQSQIRVETHREQRVAFYAALDKENQAAHDPFLGPLLAFAQQGARVLLLALLVVGVVWMLRGQALKNFSPQTADESLAEATETSLLLPENDRSATLRDIIVLGDGQVFDGDSGELLHKLPVERQANSSYFLAADPARERLFVTDTVMEGQIAVDYLTVYRTSDWSIEWRVAVPDLIRYKLVEDDFSGILPSPDGRYLYVYNYNERTRGDGAVRYWLTTLDLSSGTWLDEPIDLSPECATSRLLMNQPQRLIVLCHNSTPHFYVIDPTIQRVIDRVNVELSEVASALLDDDTLYLVSRERQIAIHHLTAAETSRDLNEYLLQHLAYVPSMPIGIDSERNNLYVPEAISLPKDSSLLEDNLYFVPQIIVIDLASGRDVWSYGLEQPIRSLTFAPDGSTAFLLITGEADMASNPPGRLVRLDLQTDKQTTLYRGNIPAKLLVVPGVKAQRTIEPTPTPLVTPIPTPEEVMTATFGSPPLLELKGYDAEWEHLGGEEKTRLTYHWQVIHPPTSSIALFTQLLDAEGRSLAQNDQPLNMDSPTTWQPGDIIMTTVELSLEAWREREGSYLLVMGIYDSTTGERLPVRQDGKIQANGQVILMGIEASSSSATPISLSDRPTQHATSTPSASSEPSATTDGVEEQQIVPFPTHTPAPTATPALAD